MLLCALMHKVSFRVNFKLVSKLTFTSALLGLILQNSSGTGLLASLAYYLNIHVLTFDPVV